MTWSAPAGYAPGVRISVWLACLCVVIACDGVAIERQPVALFAGENMACALMVETSDLPDAGPGEMDAGTDTGPMEMDAGTDTGPVDMDAGPLPDGAVPMDAGTDAGPMEMDAGPMEMDAGPMEMDAGTPAPPVIPRGRIVCWGEGERPDRLNNGLRGASFLALGSARCALDEGELLCWGNNADGELGDGTTTAREEAAGVPGFRSATFVATSRFAEDHFTCAIDDELVVSCWGAGERGQLGDGTGASRSIPAESDVEGVGGLWLGGQHGCALLAGVPVCWGAGERGQLGNGFVADQLSPEAVELTEIVQLALGANHTCALHADGTVSCWGDADFGQLGGDAVGVNPDPLPVEGITEAVALAAGDAHTCALLRDGTLRCWGSNSNGQLGARGAEIQPEPVQPDLAGVTQVVAGGRFTCALTAEGAFCWGANDLEQLGGATGDQADPEAVQL